MANQNRLLNVRGFNEAQVIEYPLAIFDVNELFLDIADTPAEVVSIWNASTVNQAVGSIAQTSNDFLFTFSDKFNKGLHSIRATTYREINASFLELGTSFFSGWAETAPFTYQRIYEYWDKGYIGFNAFGNSGGQLNGNNGKVASDRTRFAFIKMDGINNPYTTFMYWGVNDMLYEGNIVGETDTTERAINKIAASHNAVLANAFSTYFKAFEDATLAGDTDTFTDAGHLFSSKVQVLGKNILILEEDASVTFEAFGPIINIGHFISDGVAEVHGSFTVEVDGIVVATVDCNSKTIDLTGMNYTLSDDAPVNPASYILQTQYGKHSIKITNVSVNPVWMDYFSEIEVDLNKGAKPVFMANIPKFTDGVLVPGGPSGGWTMYAAKIEAANDAMQEVWDFWKKTLKAPVGLADVYTNHDPVNDYVADGLHFSLTGSAKVLEAFNKVVKRSLGGGTIAL